MIMLALDGLNAGYDDRSIVSDISLSVREGETMLVVGPNGSGKSTIFKAMHGAARAFAGTAKLLGAPMALPVRNPDQRRAIAFVPQHQNVFSTLSVAENLYLAGKAIRQPDRGGGDAIALAQDILGQFRISLSALAGQLSGGQKQCLAIALGVVRSPSLLMLDEPLAGLDPLAVERILGLIAMLKARLGLTVVIVEHRYRHVLAQASAIIGIRSGRKILDIAEGAGLSEAEKAEAIEHLYFGSAAKCFSSS